MKGQRGSHFREKTQKGRPGTYVRDRLRRRRKSGHLCRYLSALINSFSAVVVESCIEPARKAQRFFKVGSRRERFVSKVHEAPPKD